MVMSLDILALYLLHSLAGLSPLLDQIIVFFAAYFPYLVIIVFVYMVVFSAYTRWEKIEILFVTAFSSLLARFGVVELIRFFIHRPRPFITLPIHPLITETSWSFPSGHATFFFGMAMAVYLYNKRWGWYFFAFAALISLARVVAGVHYPSDVIGGALIGMAVAFVVDWGVRRFIKSRS